jgi:hypothetical protein
VGDKASRPGSSKMISFIVILFIALTGAALSIYFWQRKPLPGEPDDRPLPPPRFAGLFEHHEEQARVAKEPVESKIEQMIERARTGDLGTLEEATMLREPCSYNQVLDALVSWGQHSQENLTALISRISSNKELRTNKTLARTLIETWKGAPSRRNTSQMIHIAALSDDAEAYSEAVDAAMESWRLGKLNQFSPEELVALLVSQYWLIAPEARRGGVGFSLKRKLSAIRRELATLEPTR